MDLEETKKEEKTAGQQSSREGYTPAGNYQKDYRAGRPQRPRIHAQRAYSTDNRTNKSSNDEGGFRPEGFGALLGNSNDRQRPQSYRPRQQQGGFRPRFNNNANGEGGYQPRQQGQGGYRPRYNNNANGEGGYQPRQQGGYRPRYNNNANGEGGYQPRQQGGYRPRYNNQGGYGLQQNGDQQNATGGYQPRQQGGYQPRPNNGYAGRPGNFRGSYSPNRPGGYNPNRLGYNQNGKRGYQQRQHSADYDPNAKYSLKKRIEYKETHIDPEEPIRLNKYLANAGVCSRREADEFIQAGVVTVNGQVVTELGTKVKRGDEVKFHDQTISLEKKVYVLLNKPKDTVTTSDDPQQRKTVMDLVKDVCPERIYPVGRLDRNTTGVLLLTNDGELASKLTHPKFLKKKVYHVFLDKPVTAHDMQQIAEGIQLDDGEVHADAIDYPDERDKAQVGIEIHSGKNRIVRRIFESLGYRVIKLDRVQFAGLTKKNLRRGDWRFLTQKEVEMLCTGMFE